MGSATNTEPPKSLLARSIEPDGTETLPLTVIARPAVASKAPPGSRLTWALAATLSAPLVWTVSWPSPAALRASALSEITSKRLAGNSEPGGLGGMTRLPLGAKEMSWP